MKPILNKFFLGTALVLALSTAAFAADSDVLARVNGKDITRADLKTFEDKLPPGAKALPPAILEPMAVDQLVNDQVLQKAATDAKTADTDEYKKRLEQVKNQLLVETYVTSRIEKKMTDSALHDEYDELKKNNPPQKEYEARHMLVDTKEQAEALIKQLDGGADFAKLASQNNKGPEKEKGGELGYITVKEVVPEFGDALTKLKVGKYTEEPVKTQFGWHVIKLEDERNRPAPKFDAVKDQVKQHLQQKLVQEEIAKLRKDAKVEVFNDKFAQMPKLDPAAAKSDDKKTDSN
jgi:peptidyl-prolyl cis-trans isomerase C